MSKKNFKTSFDDLLGLGEVTQHAAHKKEKVFQETRSTFVIRCDQLDKIKAISYMERNLIKNILEKALEDFIDNYERENGEVMLPKK